MVDPNTRQGKRTPVTLKIKFKSETLEQFIETTGLPRDGFRQLLLHARLDAVHARDLHRVLDSLPLESHHEELIGLSAMQTMALWADALLDVVEEKVAGPAMKQADPASEAVSSKID